MLNQLPHTRWAPVLLHTLLLGKDPATGSRPVGAETAGSPWCFFGEYGRNELQPHYLTICKIKKHIYIYESMNTHIFICWLVSWIQLSSGASDTLEHLHCTYIYIYAHTNDIDIYNLYTPIVHMKQSSVGGTNRFHHQFDIIILSSSTIRILLTNDAVSQCSMMSGHGPM